MVPVKELIEKTRTFRRFHQNEPISTDTLRELIDLARLGGSARNAQPLKFMLFNDEQSNSKIFPHLGWAGYLTDWPGPVEGERPSAYLICLLDTQISSEADCDLGIATQNILLGAMAKGIGGCRIGSVSARLKDVLRIPEHLKIILVLALGKPKEEVVIHDLDTDGSIKYWRDSDQVHHVPKRTLDEIIVEFKVG